jgi:hypothetical protein
MFERFIKKLFSTNYLSFLEFNSAEHKQLGSVLAIWLIGLGVFLYGFYPLVINKDASGIFLGTWIITLGIVIYCITIIHALLRKVKDKKQPFDLD